MSDRPERCNTRIRTEGGIHYAAVETVDQILDLIRRGEWIEVLTMTGSDMFDPERLVIRASSIVAVQELSEMGWIWQKQADTAHYARVLSDLEDPSVAQVQRELVDALKRQLGEEDE